MRTFLCFPVDSDSRRSLTALSRQLQEVLQGVHAAWVKPGKFHVTVRFLGEIDPMLTLELEAGCRKVADEASPFELSFDRLGAFPTISRARVLWAGGETSPSFERLVASLDATLQKIGFEKERKPAVAHITLARIRSGANPSLETAIRALGNWPGFTLRVDRLILMESRLSPRGAMYTPLFTLPFGGHG